MSLSIRADQTVTGTVTWSKGSAPSPFTGTVNPTTAATVNVNSADGSFTLDPTTVTASATVTIKASDGSTATSAFAVTAPAPNVGTIVFGTPTPA